MSMSAGSTGHGVSEINVTPLIDVLLTLRIIFMVLVPVAPKGLDAMVPQMPKSLAATSPAAIVVEVKPGASGEAVYRINQTEVSKSEIEPRLAAIFATRQEKTVFLKADPALEFNIVAEVVNMSHRADIQNIGLMTGSEAAEQ
jgi:biopolymer transport protein TolR